MKFEILFAQAINEQLNNATIDINAIEQIESSGNPRAIGKAGERGATQILDQETWNMIAKDMKQSYDWDKDWHNRDINKSMGNHYINKIIPGYLRYYKIPDTIETRIAAYNWGIGKLNNAYDEHKEQWINLAPLTTRSYIRKYKKLTGQVDTQLKITKPAQPVVHLVKSGDTISGISKKYNVKVSALKQLNPQIQNIDQIRVGQKIKIK